MRIAHVINTISPDDGGPPQVALNLASAQAKRGASVRLVTGDAPRTPEWWDYWSGRIPGLSAVQLHAVPAGWLAARHRDALLLHRGSDVLHVHGIWVSLTRKVLRAPAAQRTLTMLTPHGSLSGWSLRHHGLRKAIALKAGWLRLIRSADVLHAVSPGEEQDLTQLVPGSRIAVIPNGVLASELDPVSDELAATLRTGDPALPPSIAALLAANTPYILFMARLHSVKGPDILVEAFSQVARDFPEYRLVMAGPDFGERESLLAQAQRLGISRRVEFPGGIFGEARRLVMQRAAIICQPSRYEAFSVSLLESLAAGVPVLTTASANFTDLARHGAGLICDLSSASLATQVRRLLSEPELRRQMGTRGRALIRHRYTWDSIAAQSLQQYEQMGARRSPDRAATHGF